MWLFTKYGFFSVVEKLPGEYHVRARSRRDLEILVAKATYRAPRPAADVEDLPIHDTPTGDYGFRLVITRHQWTHLIAPILVGSVVYSNFKSEIARTPDQTDKIGPLHEIWSIMANYQDGLTPPMYKTNYPSLRDHLDDLDDVPAAAVAPWPGDNFDDLDDPEEITDLEAAADARNVGTIDSVVEDEIAGEFTISGTADSLEAVQALAAELGADPASIKWTEDV